MQNIMVRLIKGGVSCFILYFSIQTSMAQEALLGPSPYLSFADSPFSGGTFSYFYLAKDIIDTSSLEPTPGVTIDDGDGHRFNNLHMFNGLDFTFDATILGALPNAAGLAAYGFGEGSIDFEAFDAANVSLGALGATIGDYPPATFFGIASSTGISRISLRSNTEYYVQVDNLQYGLRANGTAPPPNGVPEPASLALVAIGLAFLGVRRKRQH